MDPSSKSTESLVVEMVSDEPSAEVDDLMEKGLQKDQAQAQYKMRTHGQVDSTIVWRDLCKFVETADKSKKQILFDVNGSALPSQMVALMVKMKAAKCSKNKKKKSKIREELDLLLCVCVCLMLSK